MSDLQPFHPQTSLAPRDARALDRSLSTLRAHTTTELAVIDAAGQKIEEIQAINTQLTRQAIVDSVQVAQLEATGSQLVPHATRRLSYLADQHAQQAASIMSQAHHRLGRLV